jgi:hypothetical protein
VPFLLVRFLWASKENEQIDITITPDRSKLSVPSAQGGGFMHNKEKKKTWLKTFKQK